MFRTVLLSAISAACLRAAAPQPDSFKHPLIFEPNRGQFPERVKWMARGSRYQVFLTGEGATFRLPQAGSRSTSGQSTAGGLPADRLRATALSEASYSTVQMKLIGGRRWTEIEGMEPTGGASNYFLGDDPREWHSGIQHYSRVRIAGVYQGIDLVFYSNGENLEYDFVMAPGADPKQIRLSFDGMERMQVDRNSGDLVLATKRGAQLRQVRPKLYQQNGANKVEVAGGYTTLNGREVGFSVAGYDRRLPLIIDPEFNYVKNLHGDFEDRATDIAVDEAGNAWVVGSTFSDLMTAQTVLGDSSGDGGLAGRMCRDHRTPPPHPADVFVAKLSATGGLLAMTMIGGCQLDLGESIAADSTGAYITGFTSSYHFPQVHPLQSLLGGADAFVLKLDPTGQQILYSTYFGGPDVDTGHGIAVDSSHNAYVTGKTYNSGFPTVNAEQPNFGGERDGFVAKINAAGTGLVYSTYLGGKAYDEPFGITVDAAGSPYITGLTWSPDFPTHNASELYSGGGPYAFVTKLSPQGTTLVYSTYLGGGLDGGSDIAVDQTGNAFVTGWTRSGAFPTTITAFQISKPSPQGTADAFLTKISPFGTFLLSTYFGANDIDTFGRSVAVNSKSEAYIGGITFSQVLPGLPAPQAMYGDSNGFVTKFSPQFDQLRYAVLAAGNEVTGMAVSEAGWWCDFCPPPTVKVFAAGWRYTLLTDTNSKDGTVVKMTEMFGE
jgi:hypothetical protein